MLCRRSLGELLIPFDLELYRRVETQWNPINLVDGLIRHPPPAVDAQNQVVAKNPVDDAVRMQPPIPRP